MSNSIIRENFRMDKYIYDEGNGQWCSRCDHSGQNMGLLGAFQIGHALPREKSGK